MWHRAYVQHLENALRSQVPSSDRRVVSVRVAVQALSISYRVRFLHADGGPMANRDPGPSRVGSTVEGRRT